MIMFIWNDLFILKLFFAEFWMFAVFLKSLGDNYYLYISSKEQGMAIV